MLPQMAKFSVTKRQW